MIAKLMLCLLTAVALSSCSTTRTAKEGTLEQRMLAQVEAREGSETEPMPPAEGPEGDIPAEGPNDPVRNPGVVPSPLLRNSAASSL